MAVTAIFAVRADSRIRTPFQVVPLWSDEMMAYLTGETQAACSGPEASTCQRLNTGICDGTAYFSLGPPSDDAAKLVPRHPPSKQTESTTPQYFALEIARAASSGNLAIFYAPSELDALELVFNCSFSGNEACPANRFQTGAVRLVELGPLGGSDVVDLTRLAAVRPDGPIVVRLDGALKDSIGTSATGIYRVRAVAECFSVVPTPVEWELPLHERPSRDSPSAGTLVARVLPGDGMTFTYRSQAGDARFEPDWVQPDWGYTFMMDHTALDRTADWFQLPPRPLPNALWVHLPGREPSRVSDVARVYTLSKTITARRGGSAGTAMFSAGTNIVVVRVLEHALEIRKEEPWDMPCTDDARAAKPPHEIPTHVVDAAEFYDRDLHLQLRPAYPKGC